MLDIKLIRTSPESVDSAMIRRGKSAVSKEILALDEEIRRLITETQNIQMQKNEHAANTGKQKAEGVDLKDIATKGNDLKEKLAQLKDGLSSRQQELANILLSLPNIPCADCIDGKDENDNIVRKQVGSIPKFNFEPKEHHILGEALGLLDMERAAKISGSRFSVMTGQLARLERAVGQFMLDTNTQDFGYKEVFVPVLVSESTMYGTGNLPKFAEDLFKTTTGLWLIPTAEVALTNLFREEILSEKVLPIRVTALTQCFRSEAGSAGKDVKGFFRQHQFEKVELVSITTPEQEESEHQRMTTAAENILQKLALPYRVVELCTGDMGFCSQKTYDLEVWLPGQNRFREISSCSKCGDFQARRMNARYRTEGGKPEFVHTLNGSGLAVGRALIAVMENYQQEDGSIIIPDVLQKYMEGVKKIERAQQLRG